MTPLSKQNSNYWAKTLLTVLSLRKHLSKSHCAGQQQGAACILQVKEHRFAQLSDLALPYQPMEPQTCHKASWIMLIEHFQYSPGCQQQRCSVCQLLERLSRFSVPHLVAELHMQSAHSQGQHSDWDPHRALTALPKGQPTQCTEVNPSCWGMTFIPVRSRNGNQSIEHRSAKSSFNSYTDQRKPTELATLLELV